MVHLKEKETDQIWNGRLW